MASAFKNLGATLGISDGVSAIHYAVPSNTIAVIHAVYISNLSSTLSLFANVQVTTDGGTTFYYVGKGLEVVPNNTLVLDKPINLENNDKLKVWVDPLVDSSLPSASVFAGILEIS